jgi:branched-chain amino acid transport system ATP-binding protein
MTTPAIKVENLDAWYGQAQALRGVSFEVAPREIVGLVGRNGAGKSTFLRVVTGLHRERRGRISFDGIDASSMSTASIARLGVSFVREGGTLPMSLSVEENLAIGQLLAKYRQKAPLTVDEILDRIPLLAPLRKRPAGALSGGQRQSLALAVAFVSRPSILLLDEPSGGLSPQTAAGIFELITQLVNDAEVTALVVEQNPVWLEKLSARTFVLEVGRLDSFETNRGVESAGEVSVP